LRKYNQELHWFAIKELLGGEVDITKELIGGELDPAKSNQQRSDETTQRGMVEEKTDETGKENTNKG
jgi:hypothetical protein